MSTGDEAVENTSVDAAWSKFYAAKLGYYNDKYIEQFIPEGYKPNKRSPIINRGYFCRVRAFDDQLKKFLLGSPNHAYHFSNESNKRQIISIGAGIDTTYFRFRDMGLFDPSVHVYLELDLPRVVHQKQTCLLKHKDIFGKHLGKRSFASVDKDYKEEIDKNAAAVATDNGDDCYFLRSCDLRNIEDLERVFVEVGMNHDIPTFIISECVLIYLDPNDSDAVISYLAKYFTKSLDFVLYEQILPHDPFGKMMVSNLKTRGCEIKGIFKYPDLKSQRSRFLDQGYTKVDAYDLLQVYNILIPNHLRKIKEKIEILDEFEEWELIMSHYCLVIAESNSIN